MAKSRKDSRGYVLRTGESQRKDGRYSYSYTDLDNNKNESLEMLDFTAFQEIYVTNLLLVQSYFYYFSSAIVSLS